MKPEKYKPRASVRRVEIDEMPTPSMTPSAVVRQITDERLGDPVWQRRAAGVGELVNVCLAYWLPFIPLR